MAPLFRCRRLELLRQHSKQSEPDQTTKDPQPSQRVVSENSEKKHVLAGTPGRTDGQFFTESGYLTSEPGVKVTLFWETIASVSGFERRFPLTARLRRCSAWKVELDRCCISRLLQNQQNGCARAAKTKRGAQSS